MKIEGNTAILTVFTRRKDAENCFRSSYFLTKLQTKLKDKMKKPGTNTKNPRRPINDKIIAKEQNLKNEFAIRSGKMSIVCWKAFSELL